ncbi:armadillo segment polarity-like protein [Cinnamomum micranthum f. kanehirae]|uniref:Armadillo segment polarity-like protein n=1 Tax=Cinnamomum micranthum f. kanehirae TaxID=337451 RepID=A0A3S3Q670_9MAGN|nr:armadillo segment polarity-like protein [Cinnamomum micranthum f. kanehirae]
MKLKETHHHLQLSQHLISSLNAEITHVEAFKGKWSVIKTKLQNLTTHLSDLSDFPYSSSNPLCSDLLQSLSHTLSNALSLASICRNPTPPIGKLHAQSDLDAISSSLDQFLHDADLLIKNGVLQDNLTAPTTPSSSISRREAIWVEARNLITRLQIGSWDSKNSAMDLLLGFLQDDDKNVLIAVAQGMVPVVVRLLDCSCLEIKEKAVSAIARISTIDSCKHVLVADGILLLNHLLRVLESGSGSAKEKACIALQALSFSKENARTIGSRAGISSLLEICHAGTPASQADAFGVLRNLAGIEEIRQNLVEENAISVLVGLSASGTALAQENAIGCLCNLISDDGDESLKMLVLREGGVECLKNLWDGASDRCLELALGLLRNLGRCRRIADLLLSEGFMPRVAGALNYGAVGVRMAAARAASDLGYSVKAKREMGECGGISNLVRMLDAKAVDERDVAAKSLASLLEFAGNTRIFQKEERGIENVVLLLDPMITSLEKRYPVSILLSVSQSKKCRKRMVATGACGYLQKIAEMEIQGSKKLLENLSRGKLWGVFART